MISKYLTSRWKFIQEGNSIYQDMDRLVAYEKALSTWAEWVDTNVNPTKTIVFFQGVSPDHNNGTDWGEPMAKYCEGQNQPVFGSKYPAGEHPAEVVVEKVISGMSNPVHLLNVTALSQLRKDGHPSVYGHGGHNDMDCSHWCLAGLSPAPRSKKKLKTIATPATQKMSNKRAIAPSSIRPLSSLKTKVSKPKPPPKAAAKASSASKTVRRSRRIKQRSAFSNTSANPLSLFDSSSDQSEDKSSSSSSQVKCFYFPIFGK
ncbi:conserved hypothetical protein [Ricinus communis]|uniref:Trichome birefringence-like C-terminal domain-containing protein n=1 Tax=Ricinus communis TaxID=3988 RepID=B9SIR9_RICCO|nr:conserved hypothetical protein [Ricinus communis]